MIPALIPFLLQNLIWIPTQLFLRTFGHFKVSGLENLKDLKGSVIFVSNHTSELDPILLPASLPLFSRFYPIFYVSREKTFYNIRQILKRIFYGGFFFEIWGAYQTHVGIHNYEESLKTHIKILEKGHSLFIFPEGKKSVDGNLQEGKGGATFLSHRTNTPIVSIAIIGVYKTNLMDFLLFRNNFKLIFGKPIYPNELFVNKIDNYHQYKTIINDKVMPCIQKLLSESSRE